MSDLLTNSKHSDNTETKTPYIYSACCNDVSTDSEKICLKNENGKISIEYEWKDSANDLILIPSEKSCVIYGFRITDETGVIINDIVSNGIWRSDFLVFCNNSSFIRIVNKRKSRFLYISAEIIEFPDVKIAAAAAEMLDDPYISISSVLILFRAASCCVKTRSDSPELMLNYETAMAQREDQRRQAEHWRNAYNSIAGSHTWKATYPIRACLDFLKRLLKKNKVTYLLGKTLLSLKREGLKATICKVKARLNKETNNAYPYNLPAAVRKEQKSHSFDRNIKFSILVPLYNTPVRFLKEMIRSVQDQTYSNWELCLADGSDSDHADVGKTALMFSRADRRIKYQKLANNGGISENTNACIKMSSGDYIALFDHDDILHPSALYEVAKVICTDNADFIYTDETTFSKKPSDAYCPHYKPDYAPDTLRSYNYICHFTVFSRELLNQVGEGFRKEFDGSQDYDIILRLTEKAKVIKHIPVILYYWRAHSQSVASDISAKPYTITAAKKALTEHLERIGQDGEVCNSTISSTYRIKYTISGTPLVSIIIPNKDHINDLQKCLRSIKRSTYPNYEIVVVENNSTEHETFQFYDTLKDDPRIKVVTWEHEFNYSKINNFGAEHCNGEYLVLLNNDIEIITEQWIEEMLMFAQRPDIGAVGAMLYYPDDTIQHAGVILGIGGVAGHSHKYFKRGSYGYASRLTIAQNLSCVTAACLMLSRKVWDEVHGLNEKYAVAFNDVDLCLRIRKAGYLIVWTPYAEAYHYESKSRGLEDTPEKQKRFQSEVERFDNDWRKELDDGDPYYNPNLTLKREDFSLK